MSLIKDGKVYRTIEEQVAWLTKTKFNSYQKQEVDKMVEILNQEINTKQDKLDFDSTPIKDSLNPITSGGVYNAIETEKQEFNQSVETLNQKINTKQDKLNFDTTPTENSTNPVTSGGVYNAINEVKEKINKPVLLWTNPSKNIVETFPSQQINLSDSILNYKSFKVCFKPWYGNGQGYSVFEFIYENSIVAIGDTIVNFTVIASAVSNNENLLVQREIYIDKTDFTKLGFRDSFAGSGSVGTIDNRRLIPVYVYGIKE